MKVIPITTTNKTNYQYQEKTNNKSFLGYINGKYYRDQVIIEAKKALKNPNWKETLLSRKRSLGETLSTWHERHNSDIADRVIMGICTLGITEITWGLTARISDAMDNKNIDKMIKEIEECLDDMGNSGNSNNPSGDD